MSAASLTGANREYIATTLDLQRTLDASGKRITSERTTVRTARVSQPWRSRSADALHRDGHIIVSGDSATYHPPGLDAMLSEQFLADHCLTLVASRDSSEWGVAFEPIAERRRIPEVQGTVWMTHDARLTRMEFAFVTFPAQLGVNSWEAEPAAPSPSCPCPTAASSSGNGIFACRR